MVDEAEIKQLVIECEEFYRPYHTQCALEDDYYNLRWPFDANVPGYAHHYPVSARLGIEDAASQIDATSIQVNVKPRNDSDKAQNQADLLRRFYMGTWHRIFANQGLILRHATKLAFIYGLGIMKTVYDRDLYVDYPEQKKGESEEAFEERVAAWRVQTQRFFPFVLLTPNPQTVMPQPSSVQPEFWIEKYRRKAGDVARRYESFAESISKRDYNTEVDWIEY